jgi:hypothetical protein
MRKHGDPPNREFDHALILALALRCEKLSVTFTVDLTSSFPNQY